MKKIVLILMLGVFALSLSSFNSINRSNVYFAVDNVDCGAEALEFYQIISTVKDPFHALLDAIDYYEFCEEHENTPVLIDELPG